MNEKISVFVFCVEAIIYLLLCNSHDRTFKKIVPIFFSSLPFTGLVLICIDFRSKNYAFGREKRDTGMFYSFSDRHWALLVGFFYQELISRII